MPKSMDRLIYPIEYRDISLCKVPDVKVTKHVKKPLLMHTPIFHIPINLSSFQHSISFKLQKRLKLIRSKWGLF